MARLFIGICLIALLASAHAIDIGNAAATSRSLRRQIEGRGAGVATKLLKDTSLVSVSTSTKANTALTSRSETDTSVIVTTVCTVIGLVVMVATIITDVMAKNVLTELETWVQKLGQDVRSDVKKRLDGVQNLLRDIGSIKKEAGEAAIRLSSECGDDRNCAAAVEGLARIAGTSTNEQYRAYTGRVPKSFGNIAFDRTAEATENFIVHTILDKSVELVVKHTLDHAVAEALLNNIFPVINALIGVVTLGSSIKSYLNTKKLSAELKEHYIEEAQVTFPKNIGYLVCKAYAGLHGIPDPTTSFGQLLTSRGNAVSSVTRKFAAFKESVKSTFAEECQEYVDSPSSGKRPITLIYTDSETVSSSHPPRVERGDGEPISSLWQVVGTGLKQRDRDWLDHFIGIFGGGTSDSEVRMDYFPVLTDGPFGLRSFLPVLITKKSASEMDAAAERLAKNTQTVVTPQQMREKMHNLLKDHFPGCVDVGECEEGEEWDAYQLVDKKFIGDDVEMIPLYTKGPGAPLVDVQLFSGKTPPQDCYPLRQMLYRNIKGGSRLPWCFKKDYHIPDLS